MNEYKNKTKDPTTIYFLGTEQKESKFETDLKSELNRIKNERKEFRAYLDHKEQVLQASKTPLAGMGPQEMSDLEKELQEMIEQIHLDAINGKAYAEQISREQIKKETLTEYQNKTPIQKASADYRKEVEYMTFEELIKQIKNRHEIVESNTPRTVITTKHRYDEMDWSDL